MSRLVFRIVLGATCALALTMIGAVAAAATPNPSVDTSPDSTPFLETPSLEGPSFGTPSSAPFSTSSQIAKAYGFSTGDPNCDACEACRGLAAQAGMGLAELFTFCANTGEPFWICLGNQGVVVTMQEASACDDCRACSFPIEG